MLKVFIGLACVAALGAVACVEAPMAFDSTSGLEVGDRVTPFHPKHVTGPHKGTDACPP